MPAQSPFYYSMNSIRKLKLTFLLPPKRLKGKKELKKQEAKKMVNLLFEKRPPYFYIGPHLLYQMALLHSAAEAKGYSL